MPTAANLHVLDNGLQLTWEEDHRQPLIAIEARIKGGLRAEGPYVGTGLTHFIEHMLFKGTPTRPPGTIEQEVRRYGGTINAFTSFDVTGVTLFVEARYLKDALGMLADILQHAQFPPEEFEKERQVVISEIQMNLDDPDRRLQHLFWQTHYLEHPYRHPILGYQPLLEKLTVEDMARFYRAQYQPQHIVLSCVGDLQGQDLVRTVTEVFGAWPRGLGDPLQQLVPAEPPSASAKVRTVALPVQASYVALGFASTRLTDPATYAGDVLANILGQGHSSRLYETLVRQKQLAAEIAAWNYTPYDPGIFGIQLRTEPAKVPAAREAVLAVLDEVRRKGVTEAELRKAKRSLATAYVFHLQTVEAKAADLASSLSSTGDPAFSRQYLEKIEQITREDVQASAQRLLDASRMTMVVIEPQGAAPAPEAANGRPPAALAMTKTVLPNGLTVLVGRDARLPMVAVVAAARGGVRLDDEAHEGLSNLTAQLLTKGTSKRSAVQIAQQVESLGAILQAFSGRDGLGLSLQVLSQDLPEGLSLLHELVTDAQFPEAELSIQRDLVRQQLQAQDDEVFVVGGRLLRRTLFKSHPYRFDPLGRAESLAAIQRQDCQALAQRVLVPSEMVLAVFGDVDPAAVAAQLQRTFGTMPSRAGRWPATLAEEPLEGVRTATQQVDKEQALVMLGFRGLQHKSPERPAMEVATAILSGMAGRLFQAVREQHGLSYTLGAVNVPGWDPGYVLIYAATRPNEQRRVLELLEEQLQLLLREGFTAEEIEQAKRYLIGLHRMEVQDLTNLTKRAALDELYGLGYDHWLGYEARIQQVTVEQASGVAGRYLTLPHRAQVLVSPEGQLPASSAAPAAAAHP